MTRCAPRARRGPMLHRWVATEPRVVGLRRQSLSTTLLDELMRMMTRRLQASRSFRRLANKERGHSGYRCSHLLDSRCSVQ